MSSSLPIGRCLLLIFLLCAAMSGQVNTATVSGNVTDSTHAALMGAQLELKDDLRGVVTAESTNSTGQYVFQFVLVGRYTLTVRQPGFQDQVRPGIILAAGQNAVVDFSLQVGASKQEITVSAGQGQLDVSTSDQHSTISTRTVQELPLAKQDWTNLLQVNNGIMVSSTNGAGSAVSMNGLPSAGFLLTVDGTNASSDAALPLLGYYQGFNTINTINTDAIEEVSVSKGIAPASVGGAMSGNVNIISKGGTNQLHGSLLEINTVADFDARNQFLKVRPGSTFNQYGGSIGGPIIRDKLFFFLNYQGVQVAAFTAISGTVPTPQFKSQVFAQDPFYQPLLSLFPNPNQPYASGAQTGLFVGSGSTPQRDSNGVGRIDYYLSAANFFTFRFVRSRPDETQPRVITENAREFNGHDATYNMQFTHTGGTWYAVTRLGYNQSRFDRVDEGYYAGLDEIAFGGFDTLGAEAQFNGGRTQTYEETIALIRGRHSLQVGGIVQRQDETRVDLNTNDFSYSSLSDFMANIPSTLVILPPNNLYDIHTYQFGGFLQDDYRYRPNLTFNLGIRYDYYTVPKEENGRIYNRGPNAIGPGFGAFRPPSSQFNAYYPNFSPRAGLAWGVGPERKTVIRAGFGIFFNPHPMYGGATPALDAPNVPLKYTANRAQALAQGLSYPVNTAVWLAQLEASGAPIANTAINPDFPNPYSMQWTVGIQRQLPFAFVLDTAYVGNRGIHLSETLMENLPDRTTGIAPYTPFGQFRYYEATDASRYNAWQTSLERRFTSGLSFSTYYTWSSNLALGYDDLLLQPNPQDNNNLRSDYGPTPWDIRQTFRTAFLYELPLVRVTGLHGRLARSVLAGWQVSGIFTAESGLPANITIGNSSYPNSRPDAVLGVPAVESNYVSTLQYLNPTAFATVPIIQASGAAARPGNLGKNAVRLPGLWNLDSSIAKSFTVREHLRLQLRCDLFNAFNHTNLSGLQTNLSSGTFGRLTSATARAMQLGARLSF